MTIEERTMRTSLEKNLRPIPRTLDEATRNGDYPYSIQKFKTEWDDFVDFFWVFIFMVPLFAVLVLFIWIGLERLG
jgi:hypothetical protein